jgi:protein-tyrosine phosphatase
VIDLHFHLLPGIDDGPATLEDSVTLAAAAGEAGVEVIVATPHVSARYANDAATIAGLVEQVNERLRREHVPVTVRAGAEVAATTMIELAPEELARLRLGGGPWLLVEPPFSEVAGSLQPAIATLQHAGHRVVLAHPERCPAFHRDPGLLRALVRSGVLTSITAGALVGHFGNTVRRFALELARAEMIHNVASDAHDPARRRPGLADELERAGLGPLTEWLTEAVPGAILDGEEIPPRPPVRLRGFEARRKHWPLKRAW